MITTRETVAAEARSFIKTPFVHQGRVKGVGVDCVGLLICISRAFGFEYVLPSDYGTSPNPLQMRTLLDANLLRIPVGEVTLADILWFRISTDPQHLAIVSCVDPFSMVHALNRRGGGECCEHVVGAVWRRRIQAAYRFHWLVGA